MCQCANWLRNVYAALSRRRSLAVSYTHLHIGELVLEVEPADDLFQSGCFACSAEYGECTQVVDAAVSYTHLWSVAGTAVVRL